MPPTEPQPDVSPPSTPKVNEHPRWFRLLHSEAFTQIGVYGAVFAVMAVMFSLTTLWSNAYQVARRTEAAAQFAEGNRLAAAADYPQAVERFRVALALAPANSDYRMQMALALMRAGRLEESQSHLQEILRGDPTNGHANLAMARIAGQRNDLAAADTYYHRAIYGLWPEGGRANRTQARLELVDLLARNHQKPRLLSELMSLQEEMPQDALLRRRVAALFLRAGSPSNALSIYQQMARENPRDAEAVMGLGESEFQLGDYAAAQAAFQSALRLNSGDLLAQKRLELTRNVLALDPQLAGLGANERYLRSRRLLVLAVSQWDLCVAIAGPAGGTGQLRDSAQERISEPPRRNVLDEAIEENLAMAAQLWQERQALCPQAAAPEEALAVILGRLAQSSL